MRLREDGLAKTSAIDRLVKQLDADIAKLQAMRAYVTAAREAVPEEKPKRTRKRKTGLPTQSEIGI